MKRTIEQINRHISGYLELNNVHYGNKVKSIISETISTYDGTYPSFEIIYDGTTNGFSLEIQKNITKDIEKYLGLKHGSDYWLGTHLEKKK